jgi:branched-chain amino acid transport system ATP-binding protein
MLEVEDVETYYGYSYVLQGVSLQVPDGSLVALLGRNGVGKTTLIRSIMGLTPASAGRIVLNDTDITHLRPNIIARLGVGLVPQGRMIFPSLSVMENLNIGARGSLGRTGWALERVLALFPQLAQRLSNRGNELSGGEQQMLAIGRALMSNPRLLLMDEPSEGLAPKLVHDLAATVRQLRKEGISVLLVEQNLALATELADKVYVMMKGAIVYEGSAAALAADATAQERYLGVA